MVVNRVRSFPFLVGLGLFVASLGLYLSTLAPTLTWGWNGTGVDGGEFLAAANTFGIPHPPGYPTYTLLLKSFATLVPVGDFAYRGNLLSAILAAGSIVTLYAAGLRLCRSLAPDAPEHLAITGAALGAAALAASPLFWSQSVITKVYTLNAFFAAALLLIGSHLAIGSGPDSGTGSTTLRLALFGFLLGIGLGNHLTLLAVAVPMLYWLWASLDWRRLVSPWMVGAFGLGLAIYAYLPISAAQNPPVNWGNADTLRGVSWMLTARPYQEYVFGVEAGNIVERLVSWTQLVFTQFNPLGLFFGLMAVPALKSRAPAFFLSSIATIAVISVYAVTYNSVDFEVLMIPAFVMFSVWLGIGFFWILWTVMRWAVNIHLELPRSKIHIQAVHQAMLFSVLGFVLLPGISVAQNYGPQNLRGDRTALEHAASLLDEVSDGAVLLADAERDVFSLWYLRYVEEPEKDVAIVARRLLQFDWYLRDLHRTFPERVPAMTPADASTALTRILEHTSGRFGVFITFSSPFLQETFNLEKRGKLYKVSPK